MSQLSRRSLVTTAAALPSLAVPTLSAAEPVSATTSATACTLAPDLVERFVRLRTWFLDSCRREELWRDEVEKRFYAATGFTFEQWREVDRNHPRWKELNAARHEAYDKAADYETGDDENDRFSDERWNVAEAMMAHKPQTVVDIAWQAEALLLVDLEILSRSGCAVDWLIRTLFHHIRTLGALPQPDDPLGALHINIDRDDDAEA